MKAVCIDAFGGADVLSIHDVPTPVPEEGEFLIKVHAAGVNPEDCQKRTGQLARGEGLFPLTLGRDVSGVVVSAGEYTTGFNPGDEVFALLGVHQGGYAEYAVADARELAPKPKTLDPYHAAAVPLAALTAWQGLFDHGKLKENGRVLIHGAAGGVGHFAVQFARRHGARVITTARREDFDLLRRLGADEVIDYKNDRFEEETGNIDVVLDLIGGETQQRSWVVLRDGGILVSVVARPPKEEISRHARGKAFDVKPNADQLRQISQMIDDSSVLVGVDTILPLDEARRAHEHLEQEHVHGKVVLAIVA